MNRKPRPAAPAHLAAVRANAGRVGGLLAALEQADVTLPPDTLTRLQTDLASAARLLGGLGDVLADRLQAAAEVADWPP